MAGSLQTLIPTLKPCTSSSHHQVSWRFKPIHPPNRLQFPTNSIISSPNLSFPQTSRQISQTIKASEGYNQNSAKALTWDKSLLNFAATNFLPIALVTGVALGLVNPTLGCLAQQYSMSKFSTFGIFLISGLTLRTEEIGAAAHAWPIGLLGLISILLLTPYFSRLILLLRLVPQEFVTGLAIFSCMPTTLSSGVALTQLAGGNSALALAMTVISNLLGIIIVPFSLSKFVAHGVGVSVPTEQLLRSLLITLLVPLFLGKVFRDCVSGVGEYVDQNRKLFSMISAISVFEESFNLLRTKAPCVVGKKISNVVPAVGLKWTSVRWRRRLFKSKASFSHGPRFLKNGEIFPLPVPWMQVSCSRSMLLMVKPVMFLVAVGMGMLLHLVLLAFNMIAAQSFSAVFGGKTSVFSKKENHRAFVLVASQKTLPVMVAVVEQLHGALGESGLLVLPCVAAHLNQIIFDSFLVNHWLRKDQLRVEVKNR